MPVEVLRARLRAVSHDTCPTCHDALPCTRTGKTCVAFGKATLTEYCRGAIALHQQCLYYVDNLAPLTKLGWDPRAIGRSGSHGIKRETSWGVGRIPRGRELHATRGI